MSVELTTPVKIEIPGIGTIESADLYLKSEADKVIAELKADYKEACDRLQTVNLIKDEQLAATRHQKYERCLKNREICAMRFDIELGRQYPNGTAFWAKWERKWLELAERFKEVK